MAGRSGGPTAGRSGGRAAGRPDGVMAGLRGRAGFRVGAALATIVVLAAVLGPILWGNPDATNYAAQLQAPGAAHWLGTDDAGRDVLARTFAGIRTTLGDSVLVAGCTAVLGMLIGGVAGFLRGRVDAVLSRVIDVMLGLPDLVIALAIVGALGVGHLNLLLALVTTQWAYLARVTRGYVLGSRLRPDVISARLAGVSRRRVLTGHVLPGALAQVLVISATGFGGVVLSLAGLSFLGLGAQPPTAELGQMLNDSRGDLSVAPWLAVGPTVMIGLTVAAAMLISESLRDVLSITTVAERAAGRSALLPAGRARRAAGLRRLVPTPSAPTGDGPTSDEAGRAWPLEVTGLSVTYPDGTAAVRGVDLRMRAGECLAVIGESGCGKTSLARALLQLLPPGTVVEGRARVAGIDLPASGAALRDLHGRRVGFVAQDPFATFDPLRSVGDHLRQAWRVHRLRPPADVADRLGALGIPDPVRRMTERPFRWSGGMLQRASIAAATAHAPQLVIADEPSSALDAHLADDALGVLRAAGAAVLLISHDLRLVARHCDRIAVMRDGVLVEVGRAADIVTRPRHPYSQTLLAASPQALR